MEPHGRLFIIIQTAGCLRDGEVIMQTNSFIADVTLAIGASSFKVDRLTIAGTHTSAEDLLDPGVV